MRGLPRILLVAAVVVAPLACASGPRRTNGELRMPVASSSSGASGSSGRTTRQQVLDRDRALIAGLATSLAFGIVGLGMLLANANLARPADTAPPPGMPAVFAVSGGVMSAGFLAAIPFGVAVERHRNRHPEYFRPRAPRPSASLRPGVRLAPTPAQP
ncbi:hypothetical protein [Nannocystis sp.]|uniref:hypothetical protein n=1 Tax=Nannocystis sp. TaxID=1962667 RepID=UPI0024219C70|nr:hypothetical protein [Nannocystis sp.]MBK7826550.1 hypothetical protein [Nannocystis sp.]MBK9754172.1 hypothetical protein [Nannocystis sp.]